MDERLEEIQELEGYSGIGGYAVYFENKKQFEWLKEQAKKVPKLERKLSINTNNMKQLQQENQRFKEVLEFYANPQIWKEGKRITDNRYEMPLAYHDNGEKAQQALKGVEV